MDFNTHFELYGKHAFLSGSNYHWINYDADKLEAVYTNMKKKEEGTVLHEFASMAINKRIKLAPVKKALHMFVNDAIGFGMQSEQVLYYSDNCFGTADAILFKDNHLRIHDLKTGMSKVSFHQLDIYAAMFCLEYGYRPHNITIEQRLYQRRDYEVNVPDPEEIEMIMNRIVEFDALIDKIKYSIQ